MAVSPTKKLHSPDRIISVAASQVNPNAAALGRSASYAVGTLLAWRAPYSVCVPAEVPAGRPSAAGQHHPARVTVAGSGAPGPPLADGAGVRVLPRGRSIAMTRPISVMTRRTTRESANGLPPGADAATRRDPASAVPSEEPRFEMLRDKPEMSP